MQNITVVPVAYNNISELAMIGSIGSLFHQTYYSNTTTLHVRHFLLDKDRLDPRLKIIVSLGTIKASQAVVLNENM